MKKPPQKVAYLSRNSVVSEIFHLLPNDCPTAQMAEFMFQNVVYRATVYRTGLGTFEGFDTKARAHEQKGVILFYFSSKVMAGPKAFTVDLRF